MTTFFYLSRGLIRAALYFPFRLKRTGLDNIPKEGGFILAGNHITYMDPPFIGATASREIHYLAKRELWENKILGWLLTQYNVHPLDRGGGDLATMRLALKLLADKQGLTIFPEGTRSRTGEFLKGKPGIGMIARRSKCPIIPCYSTGQHELNKILTFRRRLYIHYGKPIPVDWIAAQAPGKEGAEAIANMTMTRIAELRQWHREKFEPKLLT